GFLRDFRRLNVAITRARDVLINVGNIFTLGKASEQHEVNELIGYCRKIQSIYSLDSFLKQLRTGQQTQTTLFPKVNPISNVTGMIKPKARQKTVRVLAAKEVLTPKELLNQAARFIDNQRFKDAEKNCRFVLENDPKNLEAYSLLIDCYQNAGNTNEAEMLQGVLASLRLGDDIWQEKLKYNFGMPRPEGYRKALRLMKMAEKFNMPVITFIDTPGAYPGIGAEERGQSEAIAKNLFEMSTLATPIISVVIGEGGSGGALAIGVADTMMMFEYSIYSVISPEGCASILYKDASQANVAAESLKLTSTHLKKEGLIDVIINEPLGGNHRNPSEAQSLLKDALVQELNTIKKIPMQDLLLARQEKLLSFGQFKD
ncbi:MAG: tetratricopeptide repeat protein, partial [Proteobacteria bacterium]|nr:tetratricopeptide repeat protein [Pseudomonadota bacterium]